MKGARKVDLPKAALLQFKHGISTAKKTLGRHYISLYVDAERVANVVSMTKENLKALTLREWLLTQFGLELSRLKDRAGTVIPAYAGLDQWRYGQGDLKALIRVEPGTFDIDAAADFEDLVSLLEACGFRLTFSKSAAKERIDYYMLTKKEEGEAS